MLKRWYCLIIIDLTLWVINLFVFSLQSLVLGVLQCALAFVILKMAKHEQITNFIKSRVTQFHPQFTIRIGWFCLFWCPLVMLALSLPGALSEPRYDQRLSSMVNKLDDAMDVAVDMFIDSIKQQKTTEDKRNVIQEILQKDLESVHILAVIYSRSDDEAINQLILEALAQHTQQPILEDYLPNSPQKTKKALIKEMQQWLESQNETVSKRD